MCNGTHSDFLSARRCFFGKKSKNYCIFGKNMIRYKGKYNRSAGNGMD